MAESISLSAVVPDSCNGKRLDQAIAEMFPDFSRSRLKEWILQGNVNVDGQAQLKPREKLLGAELIEIHAELQEETTAAPEKIDLNIVYEDDDILVINKPAKLVVHPGAGNPAGTMMNALLHHHPDIVHVPRAGIVHRLDKDTTGLMVVAKTVQAQTRLVADLQARDITREYEAICNGTMTGGGKVDKPIGRHATKRVLMAVVENGKPAVTHFRVAEKFREHTRLRLRLESGRTHQIRVHMSYIHHPLVGDTIYGGRPRPPKNPTPELLEMLRSFPRQALHAVMLRLAHPVTGEMMEWQAPIPDDMEQLALTLREDTKLAKPNYDF